MEKYELSNKQWKQFENYVALHQSKFQQHWNALINNNLTIGIIAFSIINITTQLIFNCVPLLLYWFNYSNINDYWDKIPTIYNIHNELMWIAKKMVPDNIGLWTYSIYDFYNHGITFNIINRLSILVCMIYWMSFFLTYIELYGCFKYYKAQFLNNQYCNSNEENWIETNKLNWININTTPKFYLTHPKLTIISAMGLILSTLFIFSLYAVQSLAIRSYAQLLDNAIEAIPNKVLSIDQKHFIQDASLREKYKLVDTYLYKLQLQNSAYMCFDGATNSYRKIELASDLIEQPVNPTIVRAQKIDNIINRVRE